MAIRKKKTIGKKKKHNIRPEINRAIKEICLEKGIPLGGTELGRLCGVSQVTARHWILGKKDKNGYDLPCGPSLGEIPEISKALDVPLDEIFIRAGWFPPRMTVVEAIRKDKEHLTAGYRKSVADVYLRAAELSKADRIKSSEQANEDGGEDTIAISN